MVRHGRALAGLRRRRKFRCPRLLFVVFRDRFITIIIIIIIILVVPVPVAINGWRRSKLPG